MNPNRAAFLTMISVSEGTARYGKSQGYDVLFGGGLFTSYADHPRVRTYEKRDEFVPNGKKDFTTAAGRYQITATTFDAYKKKLGLTDFCPASQDAIAICIIGERKALDDVDAGRISTAIAKCRNIWASFPGAGYGQPEKKLETLLTAFKTAGGKLVS